jgi:RNA polymerase sigma factor (sigma-70 family)
MEEPMGFEQVILPHLDAAYNLARWLTRNPDDARDVVQEALVRAMKYFGGYRGGDSRAWLLTIVRNTSYSWLQRHKAPTVELHDDELANHPETQSNPESVLLRGAHRQRVHQAIQALPIEFREVIVLRELEGLSYKEISAVAGVPMGTVMSRLARARQQLQESLAELRNTL